MCMGSILFQYPVVGKVPDMGVATMALSMGVNFVALNTIYLYGAPRIIDDFFQESGRAGRSGKQAKLSQLFTGSLLMSLSRVS